MPAKQTVTLRTYVSTQDTHYAGGISSGAFVMGLFGDAATELLVRLDGDEGLFRAYEGVEFLAPVKAGDVLEVTASLKQKGHTSRKIDFKAVKVIESSNNPIKPSQSRVLKKSVLVATATGICVIPKN